MVGVLVATAAPAVAQTTPTWSLAHADIYDNSYNQSSTSVITVTDTQRRNHHPDDLDHHARHRLHLRGTDDPHRHDRVLHHRGRHR